MTEIIHFVALAFDLIDGEFVRHRGRTPSTHFQKLCRTRPEFEFSDSTVESVVKLFRGERSDYDETKHRVWRIRNYLRLNHKLSLLPIVLHALNLALREADPRLKERTNP